ncbi:MAG: hypothetical protein WCV90_00290 [Candidatus Woesearchaeota archaeon]
MAFEHKILYVGSGKLYEQLSRASTRIPGNPFELFFYSQAVLDRTVTAVSDGFHPTIADTSLPNLEEFLGKHPEYKGVLFEYSLVKDATPGRISSLKNAGARKIGVAALQKEDNLEGYESVVRLSSKGVPLNIQEGLEALVSPLE